jgi:hypothetical protein
MSETIQAPEFFNVQAAIDQKNTNDAATGAVNALRGMAKTGGSIVPAPSDGKRHFVSPLHLNERYLVVAGTVQLAPLAQSNLGMQGAIARNGDVWAEFTSGVCSTDDPDVIAFLLGHSGDPADHQDYHTARGQNPRGCGTPIGLCQEQGPGVDDWYKMKQAQVDLANRPRALDPEIDVDFYVRAARSAQKRGTEAAGVDAVIEGNRNAGVEREAGNRNG